MNGMCPFCRRDSEVSHDVLESVLYFACKACGRFLISELLCGINGTPNAFEDAYLLSGATREAHESRGARLEFRSRESIERARVLAPTSIPDRATKLLTAIGRKTTYFGEKVTITWETDYPLAYAKSSRELVAFAQYLKNRGLIEFTFSRPNALISVTADGFAKLDRPAAGLIVFISSTCLDLLDLRLELAESIEGSGCIVKISEDPDRFEVDGRQSALDICFDNITQSDVVVCIMDRRYGWIIPEGDYKGKSVTHAEVLHAKKHEKPVLFFVRDRAESDYHRLRRNPDDAPIWIEETEKTKWMEFAQIAFESGWKDSFKSIVDLKKLLQKRLIDLSRPK